MFFCKPHKPTFMRSCILLRTAWASLTTITRPAKGIKDEHYNSLKVVKHFPRILSPAAHTPESALKRSVVTSSRLFASFVIPMTALDVRIVILKMASNI
jgi:hypothetical protein